MASLAEILAMLSPQAGQPAQEPQAFGALAPKKIQSTFDPTFGQRAGAFFSGLSGDGEYLDRLRTRHDATENQNQTMQALMSKGGMSETDAKALLANPGALQSVLGRLYGGPEKGTDDMREFELAKSQGFKGGFVDFKREMLRNAGEGPPSNVREYEYFKGLDPEAQQQYLTMKRAQKMYDTGLEFVQPNAADPTAPPVNTIAKNPAEEERQKTLGRERGQGAAALPKVKIALDQYEAQDNAVNGSIDRALSMASKATTGLGGAITSNIPGTEGYDLAAELNTIKANVGFDKLQAMRDASPTGGALGQVSEQENILLQSTIGALSQAQSKEQFVANLNRVKEIRARFRTLKRQAYEDDVARFGAANVPNPETGVPQQAPAPGGGWKIEKVR